MNTMESFVRTARESAEDMETVNKKIDYLHLSLFSDVTKRENETYTLQQFKPFFMLETILALPRANESGGELRPPRWYQRVYSVVILLLCVYLAYGVPRSWHKNVTDNETLSSLDEYIYWASYAFTGFFYALMLAHNGFIGVRGDCLRPFFVLCDLDRHLKILGHRAIYTRLYWKHVASIALALLANCLMVGIGVALENFEWYDIMGIFPMTYMETEPILCSTIVLALGARLRHLTRLSVARHLKRRQYSQPHEREFELCGVSEYNFRKILLVYEKIIEAFHVTKEHFKLHILAYLLMQSYNNIITIWLMLLHIRNKEEDAISYLGYSLFWVRSFLQLLRICHCFESFAIDVEQFRRHLHDVVQLDHPVWSAEARELLVYSEAGSVKFSLCHMFNMNIHLPFTFLSVMVTFCIALAQLVLI